MYLWSHRFRQGLSVGLFLMLVAGLAFATGPDPTPTPQPVATSESNSGAIAGAHARSSSDATAMGGNANVLSSGNANSGGNTLSVESNYERSAPGVGQGSLYIPSCGAAANAGGSNTSGAAFMGFAWTPRDCKRFLAAAAFQSLGMYDAACEQVMQVKVVRKYYDKHPGLKPSCREQRPPKPCCDAPPVAATPPLDLSPYMTRAEANERLDRGLREKARK